MFLLNATGFWTLYKVIEAADSLDPAVVKAKWESMDKVDTLFGPGLMGGQESVWNQTRRNPSGAVQHVDEGRSRGRRLYTRVAPSLGSVSRGRPGGGRLDLA